MAFIAGALMCIVSRLSHTLARPGALRHESYMAMYAYLLSSCITPLFIILNLHKQRAIRNELPPESDLPLYVKIGGFCILFILMLAKNFHMERGIMKRFVEDYDPEIHELGGSSSSQVVLQDG